MADDCKRTLQNDEEDIATLLANQLGSETAPEELGRDVNVEIRPVESADPASRQAKESTEEKKVMYKGKLRKLFNCQVEGCAYKTLLRKDIERHSRVHTGERPFKCFLCEKAFNRTDKLLLHQRIHAGDKRYKCTKCNYASVDSGSLIKHLRVHNGERPFKCQLCSYRARDSSQLTVHLRTHTGDSPFVCTNSKCKAAFKTNSDLKRHMVVHSEEKPHSCPYCPYKSSLKHNLHIHVQSQHPNGEVREYKCQLCPRFLLPTSRKLKNHMRKHHGVGEEKSQGQGREKKENVVGPEEAHSRRKRKSKKIVGTGEEKTVVGVMSKAYGCKLCEASFVCRDSLLAHSRHHSKVDCGQAGRRAEAPEDAEKKVENPVGKEIDFGHSFGDSLRNAEILASLNNSTNQAIGIVRRHYVTIGPEVVQENVESGLVDN